MPIWIGCFLLVLFLAGPASAAADKELAPDDPQAEHFHCRMSNEWVRRIDAMAYFDQLDIAIEAASRIDPDVFEVRVREAADGADFVLDARFRELPSKEQFDAHMLPLLIDLKAAGGRMVGSGCASHLFREGQGPSDGYRPPGNAGR